MKSFKALFASCLVGLCLTVGASAGESCGQKAAKVNASQCSEKTTGTATQVAKADSDCNGCPIEAAARAYFARIKEIQKSNGGDGCPGGAAMKGLMAVLAEDENYRPMVARLEAFMAEQTGGQVVAAKVNASDCASKATQVAKVNASDCASSCSSKAAQVAKVSSTDGCCPDASKAALVAKVNAGDCSAPCESKASYVAYGCTTCDDLARAAAKSYLTMMMEIKRVTGAEGCPMEAANQTLAAVISEMQAASAQADASSDAEAETVTLGAVSDCPPGCKPDCPPDCTSGCCSAAAKK
jgi:hypothetical protein